MDAARPHLGKILFLKTKGGPEQLPVGCDTYLMRVLVTGGTGFIGSHLVRQLLKNRCEIHSVVRPRSNLWRIEDIRTRLKIFHCDLTESKKLDNYLEEIQPEICFHLAWYAEPGKYLASVKNMTLLNASLNLANKLADVGCKKLVVTGTCFEYNTELGFLSETSRTRPSNMYASCKLALYQVLQQLSSLTDMKLLWLRLFYQYGPFEDQRRLVPYVINSLLHNKPARVTSGEQVRGYLHVEDVAAAIWATTKSGLSGVVNIGSHNPVKVAEIVRQIGKILGKTEQLLFGAVPYAPSEPMFICADNRLLRERTVWKPKFDLEKGLSQTIAWWKTNTYTYREKEDSLDRIRFNG